jgi:pantoate--beta-alanine ligase
LRPTLYHVYLFKKAASLQAWLANLRSSGQKIGFVPTMGALHEGHLSLVSEAARHYDQVVVSIFVNPTQFNDPADLAKYPRTEASDLEALASVNTQVVFMPEVDEMYPQKQQAKAYNFGRLENILEGAHRPGHFAGVGMVVARLLNLVQPHGLLLGEKDFQQCVIIRELLNQMGLDDQINLHICPTQREASGLAMSSRNRRLSEKGLAWAASIHAVMLQCQLKWPAYSPGELTVWATQMLENSGQMAVEYVAFASNDTLEPVAHWNECPHIRVLVAVRVEDVRLIDNALLF